MRKKAKDLNGILPDEYGDLALEALLSKFAETEEKLESLRKAIAFFKNGGKEPQPEKRKFKWNKVALEALENIGTLSESQNIYQKAYDLHGEEFEADYERRIIIARLSSAISQLKGTDALITHENKIGTKIYGLGSWYKDGKILKDKLGKYENEIENFDLEIIDDNEVF